MKTQTFLPETSRRLLRLLHDRNIGKSLLLFFAGCLVLLQAQSQIDNRLAMADKYFAAGDYFTAAGLYGQFLHPVAKPKYRSDFPLNTKRNNEGRIGGYQSKTDILFKQAESYRLSNYW